MMMMMNDPSLHAVDDEQMMMMMRRCCCFEDYLQTKRVWLKKRRRCSDSRFLQKICLEKKIKIK
jgi:hypothetical protein